MKRLISVLLAFVLLSGLYTGCGAADDAAAEETGEEKVIKIGCNPVPMVDILNVAAEVLKDEGYTLDIVEFTDYVLPNTSLEADELDANYFQTLGYMDSQNAESGLHLKAIGGVHVEPMGIYSEKITDISELAEGDEIAIPNDTDNMDRALNVLIQAGLLTDPGKDGQLTDLDFNDNSGTNPRGLKIVVNEAANLPNTLPDVAAAIINGNYALGAELPANHPAIFVETFDEEATIKRTNFIVVKEGNEENEKVIALVKAIQSDEVAKFIEDTYKGAVITSFVTSDQIN